MDNFRQLLEKIGLLFTPSSGHSDSGSSNLPCFVLLVRGVGMRVARVQFRDHVNESNVHKNPGGAHEDPRREVFQIAQQNSDHHPDEGKNRAEKLDRSLKERWLKQSDCLKFGLNSL